MKISSVLKVEHILIMDSVLSKENLIEKMVDNLFQHNPSGRFNGMSKDDLLKAVFERKRQKSTTMGEGIAFPYARINKLSVPLLSLVLVKNGFAGDAADGKPVKIVLFFLFPGKKYDLGIKIQSVFAIFLANPENREKLLAAKDAESAFAAIDEAVLEIESPVCALDLMRPAFIEIEEHMPLGTATQLMHKHNTEVASVLDRAGNLIGEIDCIHLFQKELPEYIKELHSVPPIHDFDPFNNYFTKDADLCVKEVLNPDFAKVKPEASLLEIIFLLSVKQYTVVHVCQENKQIGIIDRITVLDKVFNL